MGFNLQLRVVYSITHRPYIYHLGTIINHFIICMIIVLLIISCVQKRCRYGRIDRIKKKKHRWRLNNFRTYAVYRNGYIILLLLLHYLYEVADSIYYIIFTQARHDFTLFIFTDLRKSCRVCCKAHASKMGNIAYYGIITIVVICHIIINTQRALLHSVPCRVYFKRFYFLSPNRSIEALERTDIIEVHDL